MTIADELRSMLGQKIGSQLASAMPSSIVAAMVAGMHGWDNHAVTDAEIEAYRFGRDTLSEEFGDEIPTTGLA